MSRKFLVLVFTFVFIFNFTPQSKSYAAMTDYCSVPPFITAVAPPLVMLVLGRDHKLYHEAYNDAADVDEDGTPDLTYQHSVDYYGYFDTHKCYTYTSGTPNYFNPTSTTTDKYCSGSTREWSGNFLNWLSMSRMDVLRRVLYGGKRIVDTATSTILTGAYIPKDTHSWGKEYYGDDTRKLTPYAQPDYYLCSVPDTPVVWDVEGKILMTTYHDGDSKGCGTDHENMLQTFSVMDIDNYKFVDSIDASGSGSIAIFNTSDPDQGDQITSHGNYIFVTKLVLDDDYDLEFRIFSDDGSELEIDGTVVAGNYGCHSLSSTSYDTGNFQFTKDRMHTLIVRVREQTGQDGAKVHFRKNGSSNPADWRVLNEANLSAIGKMYAPDISTSSSGDKCRLMFTEFVSTGEPAYSGEKIVNVNPKRNLFCLTSPAQNDPHQIKVVSNISNRIWEWASTDGTVCQDSGSFATNDKYSVNVKVCDSTVGLESNCGDYTAGGGTYKPQGLLQEYGLGSSESLCSKSMTSYDSTCAGVEVNKAPVYFGLMTGSYTNNLEGGVIRKNIFTIADEINADGTFMAYSTRDHPYGNIIKTLDTMQLVGYDYATNGYNTDCGWYKDPLDNGSCRMWGNPIGEMMFDTIRYFAGATRPTADYEYSGDDDGLTLPNPGWVSAPYDLFPDCSKTFMIVLSDLYPSYDGDVPDTDRDLNDFDLSNLFDGITNNESLNGKNYFVGNNGTVYDTVCSEKTVSNLGSVAGLCPEEPTKKGSFTSGALAYYGNNGGFKSNYSSTKIKDLKTYAVALSQPIPNIEINVGGKRVVLVPTGKSVTSGDGDVTDRNDTYELDDRCVSECGFRSGSYDASRFGLDFSSCSSNAFCPTNAIVDIYAEYITPTNGLFRVNFEDTEQGHDYDLDMILKYEYEVLNDREFRVRVSVVDTHSDIEQTGGYILSGTTRDGTYILVRDGDSAGLFTDSTLGMPVDSGWRTFEVSDDPAANHLETPLWFAAKYGGFTDLNENAVPDLNSEWDQNEDGVPDNFFYANSPNRLEEQLARAFADIVKETSSGTSVSILSERRKKGTILSQAVFFPQKDYGNGVNLRAIDWVGEIYTFWFYNSTLVQNIREDTSGDKILTLCGDLGDKILDFKVNEYGQLEIDKYGSSCDGKKDYTITKESVNAVDEAAYLWEGGEELLDRNPDNRTIYTVSSDNSSLTAFTTANKAQFESYLGDTTSFHTCLNSDRDNIIKYIRGEDITDCRSRQTHEGKTYKLGDIIYSTPAIVNYAKYSVVFVGANDGMLHAFRIGKLNYGGLSENQISKLYNASDDTDKDLLGEELWGFIPKNALPYLRYLPEPEYCHLYYADLSPYIQELDTNGDGDVDKVILIGGMRFGGAMCGCDPADDCINPPTDTCADKTLDTCVGRSSYYALDITDPANPTLLWEFSDKYLGFAYSGPAFITKGIGTEDGVKRYVMFTSGPSNYDGDAEQDLRIFVLTLDGDFKISATTKFSGANETGYLRHNGLSSFNQAFGGRLFTNGVDYDKDGNTNVVFFGINQKTGTSNWQGNVVGMDVTTDDNPELWDFYTVFNSAIGPVTAKIEQMECFGMKYLMFGTGRWFYKTDEEGHNSNDTQVLYGVNIEDCENGNCNINYTHSVNSTCDELARGGGGVSWSLPLEPKDTTYFMERLISDPAPAEDFNVTFFSTTQPSADICSYGGRSRMWGLNCATGRALTKACDDGTYQAEDFTSTIYLQLSKGNIEDIDGTMFDDNGTTNWFIGITPETPPVVPPGYSGNKQGRILFWIER